MSKKNQLFPKSCPECGGQRVRTTLDISATGINSTGLDWYGIQLKQPERVIGLGGLFSGKSNKSEIAAVSCTNCGYTTLYAAQPGNLIPDEE